MKTKTYLFAYGSLRPSEEPPKTMSHPEKDWIKGDEIQHENRPKSHWAEVEIKDGEQYVHGYTMQIDNSELGDLDKRERPEYKRVKVKTYNGHDAWTYDYLPPNDRPRPKNGWTAR